MEHCFSGSGAHHRAVEVMRVVFCVARCVDEVCVEGFVAEGACCVGEVVGRVEEVSVWETDFGSGVGGGWSGAGGC